MAGLCGTINDTFQNECVDELTSLLGWTGEEKQSKYVDESVKIGYVDHPLDFQQQPAETDRDVHLWCWGNVIGHQRRETYQTKPQDETIIGFCASLYERYGQNFVAGLNSEFAGIIRDKDAETVTFFTDRLGSRPIYYTRTTDDTIVFSSLLQTLQKHPNVELTINPEFIEEFFRYSRTFGIYTPFEDVYALPPASLTTFNTRGEHIKTEIYWRPYPKPEISSFKTYVKEFSDVIRQSVSDRMEQNNRHGLLLSGGSDSRLVFNFLDSDACGFHMNEELYGNNEAETAKTVAKQAEREFVFLKREANYYPDILDLVNESMNFNGRYEQSHAVGFAEEITEKVDVLFSGQYSDTVAGANYVPGRRRMLGGFKHIIPRSIPFEVSSIKQYAELLQEGTFGGSNGHISYFERNSAENPLVTYGEKTSKGIRFHGVTYPTWDSLLQWGTVYPITNVSTYQFYESLIHMIPTRYPFLDNRVVDLALKTPLRLRWRDPASAALTKLNPSLANIEHPESGLGLYRSYYSRYYTRKGKNALRRIQRVVGAQRYLKETFTDSYAGGGPWPDYAEILRHDPFVRELIEENETNIRNTTFIDCQAAYDCYDEHLAGENRTRALFALATLLGSKAF